MIVIMASSIAGPGWSAQRGEAVEVSEDTGARLVAKGLAVLPQGDTAAPATPRPSGSAPPRKRRRR